MVVLEEGKSPKPLGAGMAPPSNSNLLYDRRVHCRAPRRFSKGSARGCTQQKAFSAKAVAAWGMSGEQKAVSVDVASLCSLGQEDCV